MALAPTVVSQDAFGRRYVDFAQLVKIFRETPEAPGRYSPGECCGTKIEIRHGSPDPRHISTSFVERQNLTMRMSMRRFTRLSYGFSNKLDGHVGAIALYFVPNSQFASRQPGDGGGR